MPGPPISLELDFLKGLSYLLFHAHIPVVRKATITNLSEDSLNGLILKITPSDEFASAFEVSLEEIPAGQSIEITEVRIKIFGKFFASLTERMRGSWDVVILQNELALGDWQFDLDLLAYDQWLGQSIIPELLTGFVLPNIPELLPVTRSASDYLKTWTDSSAFDEYQTKNPNRVKTQIGAIYAAIKKLNIIYQSVPASFGSLGQRVRLPDQVLTQRLGNCLDMSLLFASALENIGLNPILVLIDGHAFVGCWLIEDTFPDSVNDDPSLLTKRMASGIHEIIMLEATCLNEGNPASFDSAVERSRAHFLDLKKFNYFIDVKRARFSGIYPLPQRKFDSGEVELTEDKSFLSISGEPMAPKLLEQGTQLIHSEEKLVFGKQQLWERKLIDLSLRNNLLNLRLTRSSIQFIDVPISDLEDSLYDGAEYQILHKPKDWENTIRDEGIYQSYSSNSPLNDLVLKEFSQKRLRAYLSEEELNARLTFLYRSARHSLEENGANTLYLAIGLLRWYESPRSEKARFAPVILVPVDLIRKSVKVGYIIKGREEDAVLNITLLEKLRQDFGVSISGLDPLPQDNSGVDVKAVFNILRQAVMNLPRWDIEEQFFLGTFSFNKFILWNDIHSHTAQLRKSPIVDGLLDGKLKEQLEILDLENLDLHYKPSDILLPIPADSSQMEAVCSAVEGNNFILHGPPGTGKSQTITNIIANALYRGKRVLFVAEKMAALTVVYSRLKAIGLDPFCLELHSNKSRKAEVLSQLKSATEVRRRKPNFDFEQESKRLNALKAELDVIYRKLHEETFHGISLFEIFSKYVQLESFSSQVQIPQQLIASLEKTNFPLFEDFLSRLSKAAELANEPSPNHPFYGVELQSYSVEVREEFDNLVKNFIDKRGELLLGLEPILSSLEIRKPIKTKERNLLERLLVLSVELPNLPEELFLNPNPVLLEEELATLVKNGLSNLDSEEKLGKVFEPQLLKIDSEGLLRDWKVKSQEWFLPRFFGLRKIRLLTQSYLKQKGKLSSAEIPGILAEVQEYQLRSKILADNQDKLNGLGFNNLLANRNRMEVLQKGLPILSEIHQGMQSLYASKAEEQNAKRKLFEILTEEKEHWSNRVGKFLKVSNSEKSIAQSLEEKVGVPIQFELNAGKELGKDRAIIWGNNLENLKEWHNWTVVKKESQLYHLSDQIQTLEDQGLPSNQIKSTILKNTYQRMANEYMRLHPELGVFSGEAFESRIQEFRNINANFSKLTREMLFVKLAESIPDFSREGASSSETGILQKAIKSNGRGLSIRQLFAQIPNLLPRISPCMLMSPISVAQYLDIHKEPVDLLIFDEASQMPTSEAVGAMARAKQLIIVGDPKQMPPTNFFSSAHVDEEDLNEDLESILDDCEALSVPSKQLKWHYRSKHESLIAFSNSKYYDNSLFTFPSPDDMDSRVRFVKISGIYDRGKTRQNLAEAHAIVEDLVRRIQAPVHQRKSVGVVTFSSVQQTLIEDLLLEKFRQDAKLEETALSFEEPYFIKNLENVQGDERDVILFSICYGPDENGYMALNFGPLNRDGGWRRLNVAVSRARYEMVVYSSITADQIDLNRSKAEGAAGLKSFLAYAEKGKALLPHINHGPSGINTAGLSKAIGEFLKSNGFEVEYGVGSSGFKIDLAIVDPDHPQKYLLGILMDNKSHSSSKSSIDRLLVQEGVLELLGWNIIKVWSLDWWESPMKEGARILAKIEVIKSLPKIKEPIQIETKNQIHDSVEQIVEKPVEIEVDPISSTNSYVKVELEKTYVNNSDEFLSLIYTKRQISQIQKIVETEGPILKNLLGKRLMEAWGIGRMGGRLQRRFDELLEMAELKSSTEFNLEKCYWTSDQSPESYSEYRVFGEDGFKRSIEEIPEKELINGLSHILHQMISLPEEDLIKEAAKEFGFARTGNQVREKISLVIKEMLKRKIAVEVEGRIKLI